MSRGPTSPLRFAPIFQYRLWGGRHLGDLVRDPLPGDGPIGEAWLLSDRDDQPSHVADGPFQGWTIQRLLGRFRESMLGAWTGTGSRFPVLLKFLDADQRLSVQVHPSDRDTAYLPPGETGKTEAWVVLAAGSASRIWAGLEPGTTARDLRRALALPSTLAQQLAGLTPRPGDAVLVEAGTIHSMAGVVVFEVQQNSDVTFRLHDWDRIDPDTGRVRDLQVEQAMACIDFDRGPVVPIVPVVEALTPVVRERLVTDEHFTVWRQRGSAPFVVGKVRLPRVIVCIAGEGELVHAGTSYGVHRGDVFLLPAVVGACSFRPWGAATVLEVGLRDDA